MNQRTRNAWYGLAHTCERAASHATRIAEEGNVRLETSDGLREELEAALVELKAAEELEAEGKQEVGR
jgi:hypothetical protein